MPRFSQLRRRFRWILAYRLAPTLVVLALLVPRTILALPPGAGVMPSVSLSHDGNGTASVNTNASSSTTFTLTSLSVSTLTVNLVVTVCDGSLAAASCTSSPTSVSLPNGASTGITVYFTGGSATGTGTITLAAKNTSGSTLSSSSVTVTVAQPLPTVSAVPHLGDRRDVSMCVADCFESTLSYATPAYTSLDVPRSATLLYRSGRAYPQGTVTLDVTDPYATATSFRLKLKDSTGAYLTFSNNSTELYFARNPSGPTRIVAQFPASTIKTSAALYTAEVTMIWPSGMQGTAPATVRIIVLNATNSPYGAGVELVGVQRIWFNQSGGVLVTDGTGSATFFSGTCNVNTACSYTSPSGEFSTLSTNGGFFYRTYPDGTNLTYYQGGHHRATVDRFGSTTYIDYGWNGPYSDYVPTAITDPTGQVIALNYRDAANAGTSYLVGSMGQILIQGGARWANFGVLPSGNLEHLVDADNVCCDVASYDGQHRLTQVTSKVGPVTNYAYRYGATLAYTDAPSVTLDSNVVARPRLTLRNAADALLTAGAVTGSGSSTAPLAILADRRAIVIGPRNDSTFLSLNRFGSADTVKAPLTPLASAKYDSLTGQLVRSVAPTGDVVRYTWSANKLTQTYDSTAGKTVNIGYETSYSLPNHIYGSVAEQWLTYDQTKAGWPLQTSKVGSSTAPVTTYVTDAFGRPTSITDPGGHTTSYVYQSTGLRNRTSVTTPSGQTTTYGRDTWGRVVGVTDPNLHTSSAALDVLNRPTWTTGAVPNDTTRFQYDLLNNVTAVTDAKGQVYTSVRNALGWVTAQTDPGSRTDTMKYDIAGNVVYARSRAGRTVRLEYDLLNRVTKKIGLGGADSITYTYDVNGRWTSARTVSRGVLVSTDTIHSDSIGRTTREVTIRPGAGTWSVLSSYDATKPGRTGSMLYTGINATRWIEFWYDAAQRPSQLRLYSGNSVFGYNSDDQLQTVQFPSGLLETRSFAWTHAPSLRTYSATGVDTVFRRWYTSDSLARITERGGSEPQFQRFVYDSTDRLNGWYKKTKTNQPACTNGGPYGYTCNGTLSTTDTVWAMGYDKVANPTDLAGAVDPGNRLRTFNGFTMTYDDDGHLLSKSANGVTDSYDWDDFGQLKWVKRNGILRASFDYDGFGRRIRKSSATYGVIQYIWDGAQITAEADSSGNVTQTYAYYPGIDQLHSVTNASGQAYIASSEPGGDVNGLIRGSDNAVVARYAYRPWGELETDSVIVGGARLNSLRWRGLPYDAETGLYHMRARYYDPQTRRFISEDPIGLAGGINMYAFANGDPVNGTDPFGLDAWKLPGAIVTARPDDPWGDGGGGGAGSTGGNPGVRARQRGSAGGQPNTPQSPDTGPDDNTCSSHTTETQATIGVGVTLAFGFPLGGVWSGSLNFGVASSGRIIAQLQGVAAGGVGIFAGVGAGGSAGLAEYQHTRSRGEVSMAAVALAGAGLGASGGGQMAFDGRPSVGKALAGPGFGAYAGVGAQFTKQWSTGVSGTLRRLMGNTCHD